MDNLFGDLIDVLASFDIVDRVEGILSAFRYADWRGARKRYGALGWLIETLSVLTGHSSHTVSVIRPKWGGAMNGFDMERELLDKGINVYSRSFSARYLFVSVKRRQGRWADYVLRCKLAGNPVPHTARRQKGARR